MTDSPPILAWHGSEELKADAVRRMREHAEGDRFRQGEYLELFFGQWRGCFHGCLTAESVAAEQGVTVEELASGVGGRPFGGSTWWRHTERIFGIPFGLCCRLDGAFEDSARPGRFAVEVTEAIPVGADLSAVASAIDEEATNEDGSYIHDRIVELLRAAPVPRPRRAEP